MIHNYIAALPEISLAAGLLVMALVRLFRSENTPKTFYTLGKFFLAFTLLTTVVFYNRSWLPQIFENNPYTSLFKIIIGLFTLAWAYLSCKWFLNKNYSSWSFYSLILLEVLLLSLAISALNFAALFVGLQGAFLLNWFLIRLGDDEEKKKRDAARRFLCFALLFAAFFACGCVLIFMRAGSLEYAAAYEYFSRTAQLSSSDYAAAAMVLLPLLFMLGLVPFHFWYIDVIGVAILPVSGFLSIVPLFACVACLTDVVLNAFFPVWPVLKPVLVVFALLSVGFGVIGANAETNMRRLFGFSTLYHLGVIALSLAAFDDNSVLSSFVYMLVYVLAMSGIYTSFLGMRSRGVYLMELESVSGLSEVRPYIAAGFLVFLISLISTPPMLGFLGKLSVVNNLVIQGAYTTIFVVLLAVLMLVYAYLNVIKALYFDTRTNTFDRVDKGVYICLTVNLILVLISILNPKYLMNDVEAMLVTIF